MVKVEHLDVHQVLRLFREQSEKAINIGLFAVLYVSAKMPACISPFRGEIRLNSETAVRTALSHSEWELSQ